MLGLVLSVRVLYVPVPVLRCFFFFFFLFLFFFFLPPLNLALLINNNRGTGVVMISAQSIYTMATGHIPCLYQVDQTIQYQSGIPFKVSMLRCQIDREWTLKSADRKPLRMTGEIKLVRHAPVYRYVRTSSYSCHERFFFWFYLLHFSKCTYPVLCSIVVTSLIIIS